MLFPLSSAVAILATLPSLALALPTIKQLVDVPTATLPFNVANPGTTPVFKPIVPLPPGNIKHAIDFVGAAHVLAGSPLDVAARSPSVVGASIVKRAVSCLDGSANDTTINLLFYYGATVVNLCPGVVIPLYNTIFFTRPGQVLTTLGSPTGSTRATIRVSSVNVTCAIYALGTPSITIKNIQIDGARPALGWAQNGYALLEIGGNGPNQIVSNVHVYEPRGWSAMHIMEGAQNSCRNATIVNNQVGPAGHAPTGAQQFRRRDSTGTYSPGQWADGISIACAQSTITGNVITDATDGAIVVFGAPGTLIQGNTIIASDRQLLGGINLVDFWPTAGNFNGVKVNANSIVAQASMVKVGIMIGTLSFTYYNSSDFRNFGGSITQNRFSSGQTGFFGYGLSVSGHNASSISGNTFQNANFGLVPTNGCGPNLPAAGPMVRNPYTTPSTQSSQKFVTSAFQFLICTGPGAISQKNFTGTP